VLNQGVGQALRKDVLRTKAAGDVDPLLPPLEFPALALSQLLRSPVFLKRVVAVVVQVEVDQVEDAACDLAPGTLPSVRASTAPHPPHGRPSPREKVVSRSRPRSSTRTAPRGGDSRYGNLDVGIDQVCALHAEPGAVGDPVEADAVCVVGGVAAVTEQEDVLLVGFAADRTWYCLLFLDAFVEPFLRVELGNLFAILDLVR